MRKIEKLKKEALKACKIRGHRMSRFDTMFKGSWFVSVCYDCRFIVQINLEPLPGRNKISGKAAKFDCRVRVE